MRPPHLSVAIPRGRRKTAPVRTGIPINQPISFGPQLYAPLFTKNVTSTPYIIHAAKQIVNANVFTVRIHHAVRMSAGDWLVFGLEWTEDMETRFQVSAELRLFALPLQGRELG